jgi:hypothetical protein
MSTATDAAGDLVELLGVQFGGLAASPVCSVICCWSCVSGAGDSVSLHMALFLCGDRLSALQVDSG